MPRYARLRGSCAASTIGRRPSISALTARMGRSKRTYHHKIIMPLTLSHPSIGRLRRWKRPRCPLQGGKMDSNKYESMPVRQPISAEGLREREYDYNETDPQTSATHSRVPWRMLERLCPGGSLLTGSYSHG